VGRNAMPRKGTGARHGNPVRDDRIAYGTYTGLDVEWLHRQEPYRLFMAEIEVSKTRRLAEARDRVLSGCPGVDNVHPLFAAPRSR